MPFCKKSSANQKEEITIQLNRTDIGLYRFSNVWWYSTWLYWKNSNQLKKDLDSNAILNEFWLIFGSLTLTAL